MQLWQERLKKDWPMLHLSTNKTKQATGYCIIIKKDVKKTGVEIGFWDGKDNEEYGNIPYWGVYCVNGKEPTTEQRKCGEDTLTSLGIESITKTKKDKPNGWIV